MKGLRCSLSLLTLLVLSPVAHAHAPIKGIGDFYNGMLHPLLVPAHLIAILALGLLAGQSGPGHMRIALSGFAAAMLVGLIASGMWVLTFDEVALLLLAALTGALVALNLQFKSGWLCFPALGCGLLLGLDSAPELISVNARVFVLAGAWLGACILLLATMSLADLLKKPWQCIGVRIAGAWIAASALLVVSLALAPTEVVKITTG